MWLLDRMTFRYALAMSLSDEIADVVSNLTGVKLLKQLENNQIWQIAGVKVMHVEAGDQIVHKGDAGDTSLMIKEGVSQVSGAKSGSTTFEDITVKAVTATPQGVVMALDRHAITELVGPLHDVLANNLGRQVLRGVPLLKSVSTSDVEKIVDAFRPVTFENGRKCESYSSLYVLTDGLISCLFHNWSVKWGVIRWGVITRRRHR
jgi:hypothetical protein